MKRCPQCEFIYEDDQSLCDMDGVLLVLDSRNLPNSQALAPVAGSAPRAQKRNRTVPAFASLILALVLGMVYYVSTQRHAATLAPASTTSTAIPPVNLAPLVQPAEINQPPVIATESSEKEEPKPEVTKPAAAAPAKKSSAKTTARTQTKAPTEEKKEDSKVGSILKKTGRILKKPFKL